MKSLKSAVRRGGTISAAALSALALAACSAGQITQTSSQVPAVDGMRAGDQQTGVSVHDVTVLLDDTTGEAALKFTATNQDPSKTEYTLESVEVDGQPVQMDPTGPIAEGCSVVADSAAHLADMPQADDLCIEYVETSLDNQEWAFGGNLPVSFTFDNLDEPIELDVTVTAPNLEAGETPRDYSEVRS